MPPQLEILRERESQLKSMESATISNLRVPPINILHAHQVCILLLNIALITIITMHHYQLIFDLIPGWIHWEWLQFSPKDWGNKVWGCLTRWTPGEGGYTWIGQGGGGNWVFIVMSYCFQFLECHHMYNIQNYMQCHIDNALLYKITRYISIYLINDIILQPQPDILISG